MTTSRIRLNRQEREALDRLRERLGAEGLEVSDEGLALALLRAAAKLPPDELLKFVSDGLKGMQVRDDPRKAGEER